MSLDSAGRENKIRFISDTMTGFYSIMRSLQRDYRIYSGNFSEETLALLSRSYGFTESADAIRTLGSLNRIDDEGIDELFGLSQTISELYHLGVQPEIQNTETDISSLNYTDKSENAILETFDSEVKLTEIIYFLNNYKSVANWEYNGHGSFIAKKNATIWELGGIYWNKLFELPPNPDLIHIGDEIHLKQEVIDTIFEVSTSGVTG